jgi:hypothetical protein
MTEAEQKELLSRLDLDYSRTADFITGLLQRQATMRGLAVTIWAGILGIGFDRSIWELGALTFVAVLVFSFLDGYYTVLYVQARRHAKQLEDISVLYYKSLWRGAEDEDTQLDLEVAIETYDHGLYGSLTRFRARDLRQIISRVEFKYFYPFLAFGAVVATILIAVRQAK